MQTEGGKQIGDLLTGGGGGKGNNGAAELLSSKSIFFKKLNLCNLNQKLQKSIAKSYLLRVIRLIAGSIDKARCAIMT